MRQQFLGILSRVWQFLQTPITVVQIKGWFERFIDQFDNRPQISDYRNSEPEPPIAEVKVGDAAINPKWQWIDVANPKGRANGNGFNEFGDHAGIKEGGILTVVAIDGSRILVSYESPRGQGYGSEAGNGTLFFVSKRKFASMTSRYEQIRVDREAEKARVMNLLKSALASASE